MSTIKKLYTRGIGRRSVLIISLDWEPRDAWVGVYWDHDQSGTVWSRDVYVCLVPFLPLHVQLLTLPP